MRQICKLLLIGLAVFFLIGFSVNSYAGIGIDPIQVEVMVEKGVESTGVFKVLNTGERPISVEIRLEDWLRLGIELSAWLKIEPMRFSIEPGESAEVKYSVYVPIGSNGELMAMVFFDSLEEGSTVGAGFGIPIYAAVKGTEVVEAEITELIAEFKPDSGISGFVNVKNKGNVHIRPYTTIQVLNSEGKAAAYFSAQYGLPVQVNKERRFNFEEKDVKLQPGQYKVIAECNYGALYKLERKAKKETELIVAEDEFSQK